MVQKFTKKELERLGCTEEEIKFVMKYQKKFPIILDNEDNIDKFCIDARQLWNELDCPQGQFNKWVERKFKPFGFIENVDFKPYKKNCQINKFAQGGNTRAKDYLLTISMAKFLSSREIKTNNNNVLVLYFNTIEKIFHKNNNEIIFVKDERSEIKFGKLLKQVTGLDWKEQYPIDNGKYRLDFYLKDTLIVEYDEEHHRWSTDEDDKRIRYCREWLRQNEFYESGWWCPVIRVNKGEEGIGLNKILKALLFFGEYDRVEYETIDHSIFDYTYNKE